MLNIKQKRQLDPTSENIIHILKNNIIYYILLFQAGWLNKVVGFINMLWALDIVTLSLRTRKE